MAGLAISEVARRAGLRPSTLRYYEQIGILPAVLRESGRRRYDASALNRLAVIQRARETGFTLAEIRLLVSGFRGDAPPSERWRKLTTRKLEELERTAERIRSMKEVLQHLQQCRCDSLDECGRRILSHR